MGLSSRSRRWRNDFLMLVMFEMGIQMHGNWKTICGTALVLLGATLAGCGGDGEPSTGSAAPVLRVEGMVAPQTAAVSAVVKTRDANGLPVPARITLGVLQSSKSDLAQAVPGPRMVGEARAVSAAATAVQTQQQLQWKRTGTGAQVAALSISAKDALGLRLGVQVTALPEAAVLRVYSQARPETVYQIMGKDVLMHVLRNTQAVGDSAEARTWWTPDFGSEEVTLEIELPVGVSTQAVEIAVPTVSHIFAELEPAAGDASVKINESDSCNLDAVCDASYATQRNAVARMLFTSGGNTYACTGTLLNDAQSSGTPYFLSANHCISTQTAASTLQTDWFYQSSGCNTRALSDRTTKLYNGATLLHASSSTDVSFMRLNDAAPAGAYFAGWDASGTALANRTPIVGLHHPAGDMLKISKGEVSGQTSCASTGGNQFGCTGNTGNFYMVTWSSGTTQGGSSGSALFSNDGRYVVGTLYGGSASCTNTGALDMYGRFDVSYSQALKTWLDGSSEPGTGSPTIPYLGNLLQLVRAVRGS